MTAEAMRVLDANGNRLREGLRVLEDAFRFGLPAEGPLAASCRRLRHEAAQRLDAAGLSSFRDVLGDGGRTNPSSPWPSRQALIRGNLDRVQEAARVLEEFSRLVRPEDAPFWQRMRFALYRLEEHCGHGRLPGGLYVILSRRLGQGRSLREQAEAALAGGARFVQLREKEMEARDLVREAEGLREVVHRYGARLIVNDRLDVALAAGADGVHLGDTDLPWTTARRLLPPPGILGVSAATPGEARQAEEAGADYLGVGSIHPTATKADAGEAIGLEGLRAVRAVTRLPLFAIGGIQAAHVTALREAGADGVAVISAVVGAADIRQAAARMATGFTDRNPEGGDPSWPRE